VNHVFVMNHTMCCESHDVIVCLCCSVKDQLTAADVVNHLSVDGLRDVIKKYGEERHAKLIAHAIVDSRYAFGPIKTTSQLANIVATACGGLKLFFLSLFVAYFYIIRMYICG